jgi:pimeloyl-ACP methyl ester carboxylesterase
METGKYRIVVAQGMADLPGWASKLMAEHLEACEVFDPKWKDDEGLEEKVKGLEKVIAKAACNSGPIVIVGISAGAGLSVEYVLRHPEKINHIFSVGGVLNPDPETQDLEPLTGTSRGFKEMAFDLAKRLKGLDVDEKLKLGKMITVYDGVDDEVVPKEALEPIWIKKINKIESKMHLVTIGLALLTDVHNKLEELDGKKAK